MLLSISGRLACEHTGLIVTDLESWPLMQGLTCLQGNLILADSKYEVLTLLRSHRDDAKGFAIMARHPYPIHTIRLRQPLSEDQLASALAAADDKQTLRGTPLHIMPQQHAGCKCRFKTSAGLQSHYSLISHQCCSGTPACPVHRYIGVLVHRTHTLRQRSHSCTQLAA